MSRKRSSAPTRTAVPDAVSDLPQIEESEEPILYVGPEPAAGKATVLSQPVEIPSDEALAIRRLRNTLIQKLFTPDRTQNSWTDLKATN